MTLLYEKLFPDHREEFDDYPEHNVLFFDPVVERNELMQLVDRIRRLGSTARGLDALIIRGHKIDLCPIIEQNADVLKQIIGDTPVAVLGSAKRADPPELVIPKGFSAPALSIDLDNLRQREIEAVLRRTGAAFSGAGVHFLLPSGWHSNTFVRLADALQDPVEVDRIAEWVLPHWKKDCVVIADNGSLLPLLLTMQIAIRNIFERDLTYRVLSEYPLDNRALELVLEELASRITDETPIMLLVSVNSSGNLIRRFRPLISKLHKVVVICHTSSVSSGEDVVCLSKLTIPQWKPDPQEQCENCGSGVKVGIDPRTYERIPALVWNKKTVNRNVAAECAPFWEAADAVDAVELHIDTDYPEGAPNKTRHHPIYLDIPKLLDNSWFRGVVSGKLATLGLPDIVLMPQHGSSEALKALVQNIFPKTDIHVVPAGHLSREVCSEIRRLNENGNVLLVDDALHTGKTLVGLKQEVYRVVQDKPSPSLKAFVMLSRPSDGPALERVRRPFRSQAGVQFYSGYDLFLPESSHANCPWCLERSILTRLQTTLSEGAANFVRERISLLEGKSLTAPFLLGAETLDGSLQTRDSFLGTLRPKAAFAAATCIAQKLKLEMQTEYGNSSIDVIDMQMAIQCYFDSVILAGLMRTFDRKQLRYVAYDQLVSSELAARSGERSYPGVVPEIGWAAYNNKIPAEAALELLRRSEQSAVVCMLQEIIRKQL